MLLSPKLNNLRDEIEKRVGKRVSSPSSTFISKIVLASDKQIENANVKGVLKSFSNFFWLQIPMTRQRTTNFFWAILQMLMFSKLIVHSTHTLQQSLRGCSFNFVNIL
jgi:hypothetical protein